MMFAKRTRTAAVASKLPVIAALMLASCQGEIGGPGGQPGPNGGTTPGTTNGGTTGGGSTGGSDPSTLACGDPTAAIQIGRTRLRRMTRTQLDNTVRDLIGDTSDPAAAISPDERIGPFASNGILPITDLIVQQHADVAAKLAQGAQARMSTIAPCNLAADTNDTCAKQFIADFGLRAYRRPLESAERDNYLSLFTLGKATSVQNGFRMVVEAMLQSPFFLYHVDVGTSGVPSDQPVPLTSYELASRLSYFLWDTMPDKALFDLAAADRLQDAAELKSQAERMLADPRAKDAIPSFHSQWLDIGDMADAIKDPALFPEYTDDLILAMRTETANFTDYVVRSGDGLLSTLFTADFSLLEPSLFPLYGVTQPAGFTAGSRVALNPTERSGVLTHASFLATHAHRDQTSPVHRGLVVRENILCQLVSPPPPNVNANPLPPSTSATTRERFAAHESDPVCAGCHTMMDPLGLSFENYDAIGRFRASEGGVPIDASGQINGAAADLAGPYVGVRELGAKLAQSRQVSDCLANQWFRFALGRMESQDDGCALQAIRQGFASSGGNVRQLLTTIVLSDAFRKVRHVGGTP
jgi:hypothetical protein